MNNFNKFERKYGRYAIHNLMYYIIILYIIGIAIDWINPMLYSTYLSLNAGAILHGQIWRVVTFLISAPAGRAGFGEVYSFLFFNAIAIACYYFVGTTLERVWGAFRFNVYFFMGVLGHILAAFIIFAITKKSIPLTTFYLNNSLFLALAAIFPETQFLLMGILPIKAKWLGVFIGGSFVLEFFTGGVINKVEIGMSLLNFVIFFFFITKNSRISPREIKRKQEFKAKMKMGEVQKMTSGHHKCAVCGRTDKDNPNLEFRYCSKCEGNLEYCMDHLYTHKHVTKEMLKDEEN